MTWPPRPASCAEQRRGSRGYDVGRLCDLQRWRVWRVPGRQGTGVTRGQVRLGRMIACQILITGPIASVANNSRDPLSFLTDFRDEIKYG
jgi:hypothetical protein